MSGLAVRTFTGLLLTLSLVAVTNAQSSSRAPIRSVPQQSYSPQPSYQQPMQSAPAMQGSSTRVGSPVMQGTVMQGSSSKSANQGMPSNQGSSMRAAPAPVGLDGYCPVCIVNMKKWVKGSPQFQASYDGKTYYFPAEEQRQVFLANPAKYTPALGGDCAVCLVNSKKRIPGSVYHSALNDGRLYLFPSDEQKQMFIADPGKYNQVDVAMNGECVVCKVEMNKQMPGNPDVSVIHNGMKYQFMSEEQRKMFNMNPSKYVSGAQGSMSKGSMTKGSMSKGSGSK